MWSGPQMLEYTPIQQNSLVRQMIVVCAGLGVDWPDRKQYWAEGPVFVSPRAKPWGQNGTQRVSRAEALESRTRFGSAPPAEGQGWWRTPDVHRDSSASARNNGLGNKSRGLRLWANDCCPPDVRRSASASGQEAARKQARPKRSREIRIDPKKSPVA